MVLALERHASLAMVQKAQHPPIKHSVSSHVALYSGVILNHAPHRVFTQKIAHARCGLKGVVCFGLTLSPSVLLLCLYAVKRMHLSTVGGCFF